MEVTVWCNGQAPRPENTGGLGILDSKRFGMALRPITWIWYEWDDPERPLVETVMPYNQTDKALFFTSMVVTIGRGHRASF
jgi:hypothetical protein